VISVSENVVKFIETLNVVADALIKDDIKDFGKFDRIHHWFLGVLLKILATSATTILTLTELLEDFEDLLK